MNKLLLLIIANIVTIMRGKNVMRSEKASFDVLGKILLERQKRGWTEYALAKNSELSQSTISSWYRKDLEPSLASLERVCNGLGITLAQFFSTEDYPSSLSKDQIELLDKWGKLTPEQRVALLAMIESFQC